MAERGDDLIGRTLEGYKIEYRLGAGATGVVFRARHENQMAPIALKVLHDTLGTITSLKRRFEREARVLSKLEHPNIVHITDFGVVEGLTFIAMELLEGLTLEEVLDEAPVVPERALDIAAEVLEGLAYAHEQQVVHRDLKPANVFLCHGGRDGDPTKDSVKLLDFGLAKMLSDDDVAEDGTLTRRGRIVGTPAYMAPEQITGVSLDQRADVYAMGILLYELLADRRPFLSERRSELLRAHLLEPPPPLSVAREGLSVHPELEGLVMKALAKDPAARFANGREMLAAVRALPPRCARFGADVTPTTRSRSGATSEVIDSEERRKVSAEVSQQMAPPSMPPPAVVPTPAPAAAKPAPSAKPVVTPAAPALPGRHAGPAPERPPSAPFRHPRPVAPPPPPPAPAIPTAALYGIAITLFVTAAALWWSFGQ
ncbi:MAG: serine/threonine-protein kinase [Sandaracinus sp.]